MIFINELTSLYVSGKSRKSHPQEHLSPTMNDNAIALFSTQKQNLQQQVHNLRSHQLFRNGFDSAERNEDSMVQAWEQKMNTIVNYYTFKSQIPRLKSDQFIERHYSTPGQIGFLTPAERQKCKNEVRWCYYIYVRWSKLKRVHTQGAKKNIDIRGETLKNLNMSCTPDKKNTDADVEVDQQMDERRITRLLASATTIFQPVSFDRDQSLNSGMRCAWKEGVKKGLTR